MVMEKFRDGAPGSVPINEERKKKRKKKYI
jgi:hypothetical protein